MMRDAIEPSLNIGRKFRYLMLVSRPPAGLAVLCLLLLVVHPMLFALTGANALMSLPVRGWPLGLVLLLQLSATGCGIAAGQALWQLRPGALGIALTSLALSAAVDVFVRTTPYVPLNRVPGDAPFYVAAYLVYYGGWMLYLSRSGRVRKALQPDPPPSTSPHAWP
jgi:hypothetical protein